MAHQGMEYIVAQFQARQGDVFIEQTEELLPSSAVPVARDAGRVVLAYGEVTGHAHALVAEGTTLYRDPFGGADWLVIKPHSPHAVVDPSHGAALLHEEHATIVIPPGTYRVTRQREYAPEAIRNVAD